MLGELQSARELWHEAVQLGVVSPVDGVRQRWVMLDGCAIALSPALRASTAPPPPEATPRDSCLDRHRLLRRPLRETVVANTLIWSFFSGLHHPTL